MKRLWVALALALAILAQSPRAYQSSGPSPRESIAIVVLKEPSVARRMLRSGGAEQFLRRPLKQGKATDLKRAVDASQRQFLSSLKQDLSVAGVRVLHRETLLINSLVVEASAGEREALKHHPLVQGVYPNRERKLLMDAAPALVGAPAAWQDLGGAEEAGLGIRIGLIDSGINQAHVMFQDPDLIAPDGFPLSEPEGFATNKVIVARTFVKTEFGLRSQADKTPRDEIGHGSQVAGAAAGVAVDSPLASVSGIAPRAFLGNYKVFGTPGRNSTTTTAAVIAAINAAVADGMDVINLSLGGPAIHPDNDPEQMTIASATALGYVFVIAAGNAGPGKGSLTSPGTSPAAVTVGASTNARTFGGAIELGSTATDFPAALGTILAVAASGSSLDEEVGPLPVQSIRNLDPSGEACSPLPAGSLAGSVALVLRGECTFSVKAQSVFGAGGAAGLIVYNNVAGSPIAMDFSNNPPAQPAVMITRTDGEALLAFLEEKGQSEVVQATFLVQGDLRPFPTTPDVLAGFSGRGPGVGLYIKPDLTAPGVGVHTASNGVGFTLAANGTSFATPMVAGGAALLLQRHPSWSAKQIKSALVNSARQVVTVDGVAGLANQVGNGRLDLGRAFEVQAFMDPVSSSFGNIPSLASTRRSFVVTNAVSEANTYELSAQVLVGGEAVSVTVTPETLELGPLQSAEVYLDVAPVGPAAGTAFEGAVTLAASGHQGSDLHAVFWGTLIANAVEQLQVAEASEQADFDSVVEALAEAGPGDTIEIIDSSLYSVPLVMEFNRSGTRLDGVTIRAAEGQLPVIQVSTGPALEVRNLRDVKLQGLLVRGMETGIRAENSSVKIIGCRVETAGQPSDQNGVIQLVNSRVHVEESDLTAGSGSGLVALSSEVLARHMRIGGEKQGSAVHGILASTGCHLALFDSEISGSGQSSTGQAIRASDSQVLVKGSRLLSSRGDLGDGVQVLGDSRLDVTETFLGGHNRAGVSSFNGAVAVIRGSEIEGSQTAGVMAHAASVRVRSSRLVGNRTGAVTLQSGQLDVRDSLISASQGEGVDAANSQLTLLNSTVYGSAGAGVRITSTPALVANSILFQNQGGDLQDDGSSQSVTSNLVGDLAVSGESGNFAGDPRFANASVSDFSLTADSDAVDRGTAAVPLSAVDLDFHRRIVDGDGVGGARVDLGALEFASESTEPLILPVLSSEEDDFVGLALASARSLESPGPDEVEIRAYAEDGSQLGSVQVQAAALTQDAFLIREKFPDLREGWLEILSAEKDLMSFALTGDSRLTRMDGSQLEPARGSRLIFPEIYAGPGKTTTLFVVNPHDTALSVSLFRHTDEGEPELLDVRAIPARGLLRTTVEDLGVTVAGGYISVEAESSLFAMQLFGNDQATGGLLALDENAADSNLFGAQFASTPDVETFLSLIHTGLDETLVEIVARNEAGDILASTNVVLAPNGHLQGRVRDLIGFQGEVGEGWLAIHAVDGQLLGSISFQDSAARFLASLPLESSGAREFLLSQVAQTEEIFTGVTLLNVTGGTALVSVEVFSAEGVQRGTLHLELGTNQKQAFILSEAFPQLGHQQGGFLRVRSNRGILGFELFGRHDLEFLSAVPQQPVTR